MTSPRHPRAGPGPREADGELMRRAGIGDAGAFRVLLDRHLRPITVFAYRMLGESAEAEDVAQETFLKLWRQAPRWRAEARATTWLHRVAHNLCLDRLRARRTVRFAYAPDPPDRAPGPLGDHHRRQVSRAVDSALAALPPRQRAAITLVHHQELSQAQAAAVMGVSVEALESLLARGRRALRERLSPLRHDLLGEP